MLGQGPRRLLRPMPYRPRWPFFRPREAKRFFHRHRRYTGYAFDGELLLAKTFPHEEHLT